MTGVGRTVLVVDDDHMVRWVLHDYLCRAGLEVVEAASGWGAAERLGEERQRRGVDLALLDYVLPGGGFQFVDWLRQNHPNVRAILMTSAAAPHIIEIARSKGVRAVIDKPFDAKIVTRLVEDELAT